MDRIDLQSDSHAQEDLFRTEKTATAEEIQESKTKRARERALVRKIDLLLMPILTISYGLQYYDKAVLGSAGVFGIIKDLVLPFALVLQRVNLSRTLSLCVFIWGVICILTVVVSDYKGLVVQRFFLGLVEAAVSPGFLAITTMWYKKEEQAIRLGIWYSATGIFSMLSGALNYGLGSAKGSLPPWKNLYLFAGAITLAWSFVILAFVPSSPTQLGKFGSWFFQDESERMQVGRSVDSDIFYSCACCSYTHTFLPRRTQLVSPGPPSGGVTAFGARIVSSFGYTSLQTIAISIPGGAFTMVSIYIVGWIADRYKNMRCYLVAVSCLPVIVGSIIIWKGSWIHRGLPLFGYYLLPCFGAPYVIVLALSAANIQGSTKRAISGGSIFIGYNVGNIIGPYIVFTQEKPIKYRSTWISLIVCMSFTIVLSLVLRVWMSRENARRDKTYGVVVVDGSGEKSSGGRESQGAWKKKEQNGLQGREDQEEDPEELVDMTDGQDKDFRYSL
ncbi:Permease of the major facilitator superfamily [Phaffia rhodozyma]|uniref:Permease of the major facilitator superfamily n=1 Tax=Phaffia rhodozyma TaxID=264483 RepID=A0A0F7SV39_PHARH|nr:Permease of the major facilitator superfamily [Phaffia rhodozyma]